MCVCVCIEKNLCLSILLSSVCFILRQVLPKFPVVLLKKKKTLPKKKRSCTSPHWIILNQMPIFSQPAWVSAPQNQDLQSQTTWAEIGKEHSPEENRNSVI